MASLKYKTANIIYVRGVFFMMRARELVGRKLDCRSLKLLHPFYRPDANG